LTVSWPDVDVKQKDAIKPPIHYAFLRSRGQILKRNSSEATVIMIQNTNRMKEGPTFVPFGNLNGNPPISGM
jgi:hypothetical protein